MKHYSGQLMRKLSRQKLRYIEGDKDNEVALQLTGIYVNHDALYFKLILKNYSNFSYDIDDIKFTIKDRQKSKRTAIQETEITPIYKFGNFKKAEADSIASCVITLPKITLPESKYLAIQALEKNGERDLNLFIKSRQIIKAKTIDLDK